MREGSGDEQEETVFFTPLPKSKSKKSGLGKNPKYWTSKIRRGEILPLISVDEKMVRLKDMIKEAESGSRSLEDLILQARAIPFERYDCPFCKFGFMSRMECLDHIEYDHNQGEKTAYHPTPFFCETCLRSFDDQNLLDKHLDNHKKLLKMVEMGDLEMSDPDIVLPEETENN